MEYLQLQCSDEQQHSVQAGGVSYLEAEWSQICRYKSIYIISDNYLVVANDMTSFNNNFKRNCTDKYVLVYILEFRVYFRILY